MQEPVSKNTNEGKSELWNLSLRDVFFKYVRFLPLFVLSVAFALLISFLYLRYAVPVYSVGGSIIIRSETQGNSRENELESLMGGNKASNIQNEMEVLKSMPLMQRVVDSLGLQFSYSAKGKIKSVNIYRQGPFLIKALEIADSNQFFSLKIKLVNENQFTVNEETKIFSFGQSFANSHGVFTLIKNPIAAGSKEYKVTWTPTYAAAGGYAGAIRVNVKTPGTGILSIGMQTPNGLMGADIINRLMDEYGRYSVEQKEKTSVKTLKFIDDRLVEFRYKIDSVQAILNDFEQRNNLIDSKAQSESYFNNITDADKAINEQSLKLNILEILNTYLADKKNQFEKVPTTLNIDDPTLSVLVIDYNRTQMERQQLLDANVPPKNPLVIEAEQKIEKLRASIKENLKNIGGSVSSTIRTIQGKSNQNQSQLRLMPEKVKEQIQIQTQVELLSELYKFLQNERERQAISKASNVSNSDIINKAYPSGVPVKPNKKAIRILAILLGLGIPAMIIFASEMLSDKVQTRFDIEKITQAPILGEIGHSYSDKVLIVSKTTRSMVAEQFRIIRSNLQYILNKKEKSTILITSSFSGEGKSYVSTNMGAVLALAGKKTIILEFDIRKPKILSGLAIAKGPGITNYLVGKANLEEVIKPVPGQDNLFVLGCGPVPPNPSELLLDARVDEMFAWLQANFDVVLIDTAPVGMVSDAMTLSKHADCTLYLVRQGHTFKKQIALIDEFYINNKLPKVSIIINDVKLKPGYGYYGYGRYGYGYGYDYASYYEEEAPPRGFFERALDKLDIRRAFRKSKKK
ncbi:MAG TPA: polysaccharide biosynthesis tyrosine autokinase [Chitinophagaceae bacterium]|nr:polysaccharide biosynthesis tyrosine autokinase [Chitinophagaceae bacterium]